jgi:hypothetical protein
MNKTETYQDIKCWIENYHPARYSFLDSAHEYVPLLLKALELADAAWVRELNNRSNITCTNDPGYWIEKAKKHLEGIEK